MMLLNTPEQIEKMVHLFYDAVRKDTLLAPVFEAQIGEHWDQHLHTMTKFWSSVLLQEPGYHGRPFPKHMALDIQPVHFERWLMLFNETIKNHFEGAKADEAIERAQAIAHIFMSRMAQFKVDFQ